ncbi:MAG: homocysteine S-methyltransferase [Gammaproteobacteria bacterium]|nr:MAG: homocysteine S-methyltransferase [Gammaproteobacteria bacterium]UCH41959.1 MAG: homocysteine S-methyltransferase [Gammaproteobacteria bacterium]
MTPVEAIRSLLDSGRPLILDGGLGGELDTRGYDISSPLWSAALIASEPEAIVTLHRDYLDAGAQCITTSSYQASVTGLQALGMNPGEVEKLFKLSVELACRARDEYLRENPGCEFRPLVAASVGPYGAYLADGSEYRGNYGLDDARLREFHQQRLRWLDDSGADLLACETMPDLQELRVLAGLLQSVSTPAWVSFCCRDADHLHDGNGFTRALELFVDHERVFALGANCCPPALIEPLIANIVAANSGKLIVVYPNSGQQYDADGKHWHGDSELQHWSQQAEAWFAAGAGLIGGCCSVGPAHIRELAARKSWHC